MAAANLFPEVFSALLRDAIARFLQLDPNSPRYLAPLTGKVIGLRMTPWNWMVYLCPNASTIEILPSFPGQPDVTFSGTPLAFARLGLSQSPQATLFSGDVVVDGDMTTARRFQILFERLDIDWEAALARWTGRRLAQRLVADLRASHAWRVESVAALQANIAEYWQEESRELPAAAETDCFYADVDQLRADYDRLAARVTRLQGIINGNA